ncbi:MAG: iron-containing alcohol dehydrogenase [Armatimonadetes bacterium]|nr:iron-containing alcohol dehydrogenase [Armatimonadota bacterium]
MWTYRQPTEIAFGLGAREALPEVIGRFGGTPLLVTDRALAALPVVADVRAAIGGDVPVFSDIDPNPVVASVDALARMIGETGADVVVGVGGGSSLDCAKAACSVAVQGGPTRRYHSGGETLDERHLPLIAVPTTAGTGSEVTPNAVLGDPEKNFKAPIVHPNFYPAVAVVDPELTVTMPRPVTAATGLDALAHALEGYWSKNHQAIADALAMRAAALVFEYLPRALEDGDDIEAREGMSLAALLGGMAFQGPQNAAVHACSFPLSNTWHLPHGTACAMTLDHFARFNAPAMGERGAALAQAAGFADMEALADGIAQLKRLSGLPVRLSEIGVTEEDLPALVEASFHPLMNNNPREVTPEELTEIYRGMM